MNSSVKLVALLALLAAFSLVAVAAADTLKVSRAAQANKTFARLLCKGTSDTETSCVASRPGACHRISDPRVRCALSLTLESVKDKRLVRCRALTDWVLHSNGQLSPDFLGLKSCVELRAPEPPPTP
jgi:hypothetical protein